MSNPLTGKEPLPKLNKSYRVFITFHEGVSEHNQVKEVNMAPGMAILKFRDKEVIVPITPSVREIEISEEAILS